jgi:hypothetical protein
MLGTQALLRCPPPSRKEGFGKGQREAPFLTIGRQYRNPFEAQETLDALLRRSVRGRFDA